MVILFSTSVIAVFNYRKYFSKNFSMELSEDYFSSYDNLWDRKEQKENFENSIMGFLSEAHRKNVERISEKTINQEYQSRITL